MVAKGGGSMEGALKLLLLALRIAIAWTLLSLLLSACWWLLLEVGRRFGSKPMKPPVGEERQLSAEVRAIYADFADVDGASGDVLAPSNPDETAGSDSIVFLWWSFIQKR